MNSAAQILEQGAAHHRAGRLQQAEQLYRQVLQAEPDHTEALYLLGLLARDAGRADVAADLLRRAVKGGPSNPLYRYALGSVLLDQRHYREAAEEFVQVRVLAPDHPGNLNNLGIALKEQGRFEEAASVFEDALQRHPGLAVTAKNLGNVLEGLGRMTEAEQAYRRAIASKPDYVLAYLSLVRLKRFTEHDEDVRALERLSQDAGLGREDRQRCLFALGKVYEDLGEYDRAFGCLEEGNRIKRSSYQYDIAADETLFSEVERLFTRRFFEERADYGVASEVPIFVVGLPRSGSTLVEQILSSHSRVVGLGEISDLPEVILGRYPSLDMAQIAAFTSGQMATFAADYLERVAAKSGGAEHIVDKRLPSFQWIGLIHLLFPRARIIHCRRDPVDTCWSCFKIDFGGVHKYAYDLEELGRYYLLYRQLMAHWHRVLPGVIHDVQYEALVADPESQARRLLAYCGLEWEPACLKFHETKRTVYTASVSQVRQPIYQSAVKRWQRYADHLAPLLAVLGEDGRSD